MERKMEKKEKEKKRPGCGFGKSDGKATPPSIEVKPVVPFGGGT